MTRIKTMSAGFLTRSCLLFFSAVIAGVCLAGYGKAQAAEHPGKKPFQQSCGICHTIGGGRLVGPDLAGVHDRRSPEWLYQFTKSSQSLIKSGDPEAVAIFEEFNGMVMPDAMIPESQIDDVLDYIRLASLDLADTAAPEDIDPPAGEVAATETTQQVPANFAVDEENIRLGRDLFQGTVRFENGGPTCIACHHVKNDAVIGGGILAAELTSVFSRMGEPGVRAIITNAPFPVMETAYRGKPLTEREVQAVVAFLQDADEHHAYQQPKDYGTGLLASGIAGSFLLFGFYSLLWFGRKRESVNQKIYDRQVKSS